MAKSTLNRPKPLAGRQLHVMAVGIAILVHGGISVSKLRDNASHTVESIPIYIVLEILIGGFIALYGSIGRFEPIRVPDAPKPMWESLHTRHDFMMFHNRANAISDFIEEFVAVPPNVPLDQITMETASSTGTADDTGDHSSTSTSTGLQNVSEEMLQNAGED